MHVPCALYPALIRLNLPNRSATRRARLRWRQSWSPTSPGPGGALRIGSARVDNRSAASRTLQTLYDHQSHLCRPQRESVARHVEMTALAPSSICVQSLCKAAEAMTAACVSKREQNLGSGRAFVTKRIFYLPGLPNAVEPHASRMLSNGPIGCTRNPPWSRGSWRRYLLELRQSLRQAGHAIPVNGEAQQRARGR